jgi:hypothetical protein
VQKASNGEGRLPARLDLARRVSSDLSEAEERARKFEVEGNYFRDRAARAEEWLVRIESDESSRKGSGSRNQVRAGQRETNLACRRTRRWKTWRAIMQCVLKCRERRMRITPDQRAALILLMSAASQRTRSNEKPRRGAVSPGFRPYLQNGEFSHLARRLSVRNSSNPRPA